MPGAARRKILLALYDARCSQMTLDRLAEMTAIADIYAHVGDFDFLEGEGYIQGIWTGWSRGIDLEHFAEITDEGINIVENRERFDFLFPDR
jgi:hypothetical protein